MEDGKSSLASSDKPEIPSICERFRNDKQYRRKLFHTACTTWAMVSSGACHTLIGLAFPDLMVLIKQELAEASWIFTSWSFGNMLGSLLAGYAYDRLNKLVVLVTLSLGLAITTAATPWCTNFSLMLIVHLIGGGFASGIHLAVTADTIYQWKTEKVTFLQIVHLAATAGGILSPFLVNPFLSKRKAENGDNVNTTVYYTSNKGNISSSFPKSDNWSTSTTTIEEQDMIEIEIQYAYLFAAAVALIGALSYIIVYIVRGNVYGNEGNDSPIKSVTDHSNKQSIKILSKKTISFFVFIVSVQVMLYVTMQRHEFGLFMTYVIQNLYWSKKRTSNIMAIFWCVFCLGRIIAIIALRIVKEDSLNWCYTFLTSVGTIGLCVSLYLRVSISVVVFLFISAFGKAPVFTFMLSWFSSHVTLVSGRITGVIYVFMAIGSMVVPALSGYLMNNVSYDWFIYILFILLLLFIFVTFILRLFHRKLFMASD